MQGILQDYFFAFQIIGLIDIDNVWKQKQQNKLPSGLNLFIAFVMFFPNVREHTSIFDKISKV